ncbi:Major facilitator superfamily protein, partial [Prunus dulcis]
GHYKAMAVCWFLGLGSLVAWNSLLTIGDYYYKLVSSGYHPSRVLTLVYQPFALITMVTLAYHEAKLNTRKRNLIGYALFFLGTLMLIVLRLGVEQLGPYIGICACVGAFGVADAHVQGGMVGDLSFMHPEFIQSFFAGLAASGALTSGMRLMTKAAFEKYHNGLRKGASIDVPCNFHTHRVSVYSSYAIYFPRLPIVKYYRSKAASEGSKTVSADLAAAGIQTQADIENIDYALDLFLIYVLTLSIFPGFIFENTGKHQLGTCMAHNLSVLLIPLVSTCSGGNVQCVGFDIKIHTPCEMPEDRIQKGPHDYNSITFPVRSSILLHRKIRRQGWMILLTSVLGLTNGYLTVCVMTVAPRVTRLVNTGPEQNALGNILVLCLLCGIFAEFPLTGYGSLARANFKEPKCDHQEIKLL